MFYLVLTLTLLNSTTALATEAAAKILSPLTEPYGKQYWTLPTGIEKGQQLIIHGQVIGNEEKPQRLLIRIDSQNSHNYQSRFNLELLFPAGNFRHQLDLDQLFTSAKKRLLSTDIRQLYIVPLDQDFRFQKIQLQVKPQAPEGIIGWDFGAKDQNPAWGFTAVSPDSTTAGIQIQGASRVRQRPYFDDLIQDGIEGLTDLQLPLANGLWHLRLWTEDIGEWEYFPHALEQRIKVNGQTIYQQNLTPTQWIAEHYLTALPILNTGFAPSLKLAQQRFWYSIGSKRGRPVDTLVQVNNGQIHLSFSSPDSAGRFISALIAVPVEMKYPESRKILNRFEQLRADQFANHWPVVNNHNLLQALPKPYQGETLAYADQEKLILHFTFERTLPALNAINLPVNNLQLYQVRQQLKRVGGQEQALQQEAILDPLPIDNLSLQQLQPKAGEHWLLVADFDASQWVEHQHRNGAPWGLEFGTQTRAITLQALNLKLPPAPVPVGIYLDYAPHLTWFDSSAAQQQSQCDYRLLKKLGLTGVAPALPTPSLNQEQVFKQAVQQPLLAGLLPPFPAYTPVKRLLAQYDQSASLQQLAKLSSVSPLLLWSLADEPGLHPEQDQQLSLLGQSLHRVLPKAQRMAQLNQAEHDARLEQFDAVLLNQGYRLNAQRLAQLQQKNKALYLYNLPNLRLAAGYYLWRSNAKGFWQWHGRMPTAHPFDPTDGREDDVQFLLPSAEVCGATQINSRLISLVQGIEDLRWLTWLEQQAQQNLDAALLQQQIQQQISLNWSQNTMTNQQLDQLTQQIKHLWQNFSFAKLQKIQ
ncbi:hypothetical protein BTE48_08210 [Oceanospirillum multiglobuliferum]|uniref:Glycoside hydrolase 123 C-terminal domain-containing protein n=2 Tax=Oceanospirillum multiglobuliferum TaxID=64969 RepID=A0A1V4T5Y2_9GAMM|nr:hypothetical protein BTE48_08210 [Oceanospirillum multiglobuliferum]